MDPKFVASSQKKGLAIPTLMPNSAQYWQTVGHDLFAMVRQLGKPAVFLTVSAAEYHWPLLLKALQALSRTGGQLATDINIGNEVSASVPPSVLQNIENVVQQSSEEDSIDIPGDERLKLIREDPVVCAMYFQEVVRVLEKLMTKPKGPMGRYPVSDFFFRIEFQARGSPHLHALLWIKNAPDPLEDPEGACKFADEILTCSAQGPLAERNRHNHTTTCFKSRAVARRFAAKQLDAMDAHRHCRFGAPFWPTPVTRFIHPLYEERDERSAEIGKSWKEYLEDLKKMRLRLKDVLASDSCPDTLEEVWRLAGCPDEQTYLLAVRSGVMHPMFMYKREVADRWYNPRMLWVVEAIWSNSDCQIPGDIYSLVRYCVSYITKGEKCRSELYREITRLRQEKGFDDRALLQMLSSQALRAKETSAQEAAWVLLKYPMSKKSRFCRFIDTSPPEQRTRSPKTNSEIANLPAGSTNVWRPDIYDNYAKRPAYLEECSLAVYVAKYHNCTRINKETKENAGRLRDWFIRYRRFDNKSEDISERENFYRAMCTLHMSWRDEEADILRYGDDGQLFETLYNANAEQITEGRRRFENQLGLENELDAEVQTCVAEDEGDANEATDRARRYLVGHAKYVFDDTMQAEYMDDAGQDMSVDLPIAQRQPSVKSVVRLQRRGKWDDEIYRQNIRQLNQKQKEVVLTIIDGIRLRSEPRFIFIDGSAGSGKSVIARNIVNALETFAPNRHPGYPKSVVGAPTGKAAFLIGGETIHSIYRLVCDKEQGSTQRAHAGEEILPPLSSDRLAHLQNEFCDLYGQVVDEVSMLSQKNLLSMDERCRMAKGTSSALGGLWTIFLGDFRQLEPVCGTSIYSRSTTSIAGCISLWRRFEYTELTENMRQGAQKEFAEVLKKIGDAQPLLDNERKMLESRMIRRNNLQVPPNAVRIFRKNKDVDKYNNDKLLENPPEKIIPLIARDRVEKNREYVHSGSAQSLRRREQGADYYLKKASGLTTQQARGLPTELKAVIGYPYMLTVNIDTSDGLVNGAVGTLAWIEVGRLVPPAADPSTAVVDGEMCLLAVRRLWLSFPGNTGRRTSEMYKQQLAECVERSRLLAAELQEMTGYEFPGPPADCTGLVPIERKDYVMTQIKTEHWRRVSRQQFPLVPGLAFTFYKVQGGTYDCVCVEYDAFFENELVYVGVTRVTSLDNLYIDDRNVTPDRNGLLFRHPISLDNEEGITLSKAQEAQRKRRIAKLAALTEEKARLRSCALTPRWHQILTNSDNPSFARIVYLNVQSLPRHLEDVRHDRIYMEADVLLFAETWLQPEQSVSLAGNIVEVARCDRQGGRRGGGVVVYSRVPARCISTIATEEFEMAAAWVGVGLRVAVMYCHGHPSVDSVLEAVHTLLPPMPHCQTLLCGDFNIDLMAREPEQRHRLLQELEPYGLIMQNSTRESTTYDSDGTVIDATFASWPLDSEVSMVTQRYQAYFSHHLPLVTFLPRLLQYYNDIVDIDCNLFE